MIFQELGKLKRQSIMNSIIMMALGILMLLCPEEYIMTMVGGLGSVLLIVAVLGILEYINSSKVMIQYVYLTLWLIIGIVGTTILVFDVNSLYAIGLLFGVYLILNGLGYISNALTYARRAGRKGWRRRCCSRWAGAATPGASPARRESSSQARSSSCSVWRRMRASRP